MAPLVVRRIILYPLSIPLRQTVVHAGSQRGFADPIVVGLELADGTVGYGETLPRTYITSETTESVMNDVQAVLAPAAKAIQAASFPEALEAVEALPWRNQAGGMIPAARAAVELSLLDAAMRSFHRSVDDIVQWMGLPGFGSPGSLRNVRYSGVLAASTISATVSQLRRMYWSGLRHFKLKVGMDEDRDRLLAVAGYLRRPLARERATLRLDANGAWTLEQAEGWLARLDYIPIAAMEQPLPRGQDRLLPRLREHTRIPFLHDESLVTMEDANRLIEMGIADGFNIRVSKCGGLLPSLRIAGLARREGVQIQVGCTVGETSLLSAAGLRLLEVIPGVSWLEGCFGNRLLGSDVVHDSLRYGYGGRPPRLKEEGVGVPVAPSNLEALCTQHPVSI